MMRSPADGPLISVIIPARNEGRRLHTAVASIITGRSPGLPLQIVVVDDASSDDSCAELSRWYSWARDHVKIDVIRLPRWSGIPYARNFGAQFARADILFITDANVRFQPYWDCPIWEHIAPDRVLCATIADADSSFRGFGCTLHLPSMSAMWLKSPRGYGGYVPIAPCAATIIPADLFRRTGGYDTSMPIYGAAEPEFSVRLWLGGAEIVALPNLVLEHRFRPASERHAFLEPLQFVQVHNYLRFGLLYLDQSQVAQMLQHYATAVPQVFEKAVRRVWSSDVWNRRDLLQRRMPLKFDFFVRRFNIRDAAGQLAVRQREA